MFGWYTWGDVVQVQRCDVDRYVKCDQLHRRRSFPNVIPEDTRDVCTQDVQLVERDKIFNKTNHFERLGVFASHESL
jgi:hypothetical protein